MSQEAVDSVLSDARAAFAAGDALPRRYRYDGTLCCILGAAAIRRGVDRSLVRPNDFAYIAGLTTDEANAIVTGWDNANMSDEWVAGFECATQPAFHAARALYRELVPQP